MALTLPSPEVDQGVPRLSLELSGFLFIFFSTAMLAPGALTAVCTPQSASSSVVTEPR